MNTVTNIVRRVDAWSEKRYIKWVLLLRVILGIILLVKGFSFIMHTQQLEDVIAVSRFKQGGHWLAMLVAWANLFGGVMIIVGLLTRVAVIIQLPILIGAVFFINAFDNRATSGDAGLSILALVLSVFFLLEGGGPYSMDRYMKRKLL